MLAAHSVVGTGYQVGHLLALEVASLSLWRGPKSVNTDSQCSAKDHKLHSFCVGCMSIVPNAAPLLPPDFLSLSVIFGTPTFRT